MPAATLIAKSPNRAIIRRTHLLWADLSADRRPGRLGDVERAHARGEADVDQERFPSHRCALLTAYYDRMSSGEDRPDLHVIDITMMSVKSGNCDTSQTIVGFRKYPDK